MLVRKFDEEYNVTKGAYESIYKPLGYKPVKEIKEEKIEENDNDDTQYKPDNRSTVRRKNNDDE